MYIYLYTHTHTCGSDSKESAMWETQVRSLGQEDPLEKGMATHTRILAWRIPWTERSLADYRPWGCKYLDTHLTLSQTYIYPYTHTHLCVCVLSHFGRVWLFATIWTVAHQAPLFVGFSRQEYWSRLPFPPPGDLLIQGSNHMSCGFFIAGGFFTIWDTREDHIYTHIYVIFQIFSTIGH